MGLGTVLDDLSAEQQALDAVLTGLAPRSWELPTPSAGWTVAHQVAHLTFFDRAAARAITDPGGFAAERDAFIGEALADPDAVDRLTLSGYLELSPPELLSVWREARAELRTAASGLAEGSRIEWYGPSMSPRSFLTARLMEVWAHGLDIIDALDDAGVDHPVREPSDRLRHIAHLGVVTRGWSYAVRGADAPQSEVRVELRSPGGAVWTWGPEDASQRVTGSAEEFCAVVTQRRNVADTDIATTGEEAREWMSIAQAFAGGPTTGPPARRR